MINSRSPLPKRIKGHDYAHASPLPWADQADLVGVHHLIKIPEQLWKSLLLEIGNAITIRT